MLIPYNTDAAIYHRPFATVGLIAANTVAFLLVLALVETSPAIVEELILQYGRGPRPWQWITSNFVHGGWMHLLGNMFCLWGFGLVVEGKIGWWRMLVVYFAIGVGQCAFEQTMMLFAGEGGSFGASAIVYGLLAMCGVWSPENEMNCVLLLGVPRLFEAKLSTIATVLFFIEIATGIFSGLSISSQALHLMGGVAGFGVGVLMLRKGWVDCEGWDLFSVIQDRPHKQIEEDRDAVRKLLDDAHKKRIAALDNIETVSPSPRAKILPSTSNVAIAQPSRAVPTGVAAKPVFASAQTSLDPNRQAIHAAVRVGDPVAAFRAYEAFTDDPLNWPPPELELLYIISCFHQQKRWSESIPAMVEYLRYHTSKAVAVRLKLAHILLEAEKRPAQAIQVLSKLKADGLSQTDRDAYTRLVAHAKQRRQVDRDQQPVEDW
jgi:membrane associated rhomboid family serine protease